MIQQALNFERKTFPSITELRLREGTDNHFIYKLLLDGSWWNVIDIMKARGPHIVNWAVRSRVSNLNTRLKPFGFKVDARLGVNRQGEYKLEAL